MESAETSCRESSPRRDGSGVKVLILSSKYPPHGVGGAERVAQTLAETLVSEGHQPVVLTLSRQDNEPEREVGGVRVRTIPLRNVYSFSQTTPASKK